jgi:hypothetical protein
MSESFLFSLSCLSNDFNPIGLKVITYINSHSLESLCIGAVEKHIYTIEAFNSELFSSPVWAHNEILREEVYLDMSDSSTTDRLLRYLAKLLKLRQGFSAPEWQFSEKRDFNKFVIKIPSTGATQYFTDVCPKWIDPDNSEHSNWTIIPDLFRRMEVMSKQDKLVFGLARVLLHLKK